MHYALYVFAEDHWTGVYSSPDLEKLVVFVTGEDDRIVQFWPNCIVIYRYNAGSGLFKPYLRQERMDFCAW